MHTPADLSFPGFHVTHLDDKGRCNFPSELRQGAVDIPVYLFYSPQHRRLIAALDKQHLQQKFPETFRLIPLQEASIGKKGKIFLGWKLLRDMGIDGLQNGSKIRFVRALDDENCIEIHFLDETVAESIRIRTSIADSVA